VQSVRWPGAGHGRGDRDVLFHELRDHLSEKIDVNGPDRHPIYSTLTGVADAEGTSGDIRWNFEKFLVADGGDTVVRFSPMVAPDDSTLVATIERLLGA